MKNVDWKKVAVTAGAIGVGIALTVATGGLGAASSSETNSLLRHGVDTVGETVIDTLSDAAQGGQITPTSIGTSLLLNAVTEGVSSRTVRAPKADVVTTKPTGGRLPMTLENLQMFAEKPKAKSSDIVQGNRNWATGTRPPNLSPEGAGRKGAFNEAKRHSGIPTSQSPDRVEPNFDRRGRRQPGRTYEFDQIQNGRKNTITIRDDAGGHIYLDDPSQNRGPYFNDMEGNHYDY